MDATENDAPGDYKAKGFPTIHFFKAGEKQAGVDYEGDRSSKAIIDWLKKQATHKFEFDTSTLGEDPAPAEDDEMPEGDEGAEGEEDVEGEDIEDEGPLPEGDVEGEGEQVPEGEAGKDEL